MSTEADSETSASTQPKPLPAQPIVAKAGSYYRNMRYLICALCVFMGAWFLYDGMVGYPAKNKKVDDVAAKRDAATDPTEIATYSAELTKLGEKHPEGDLKNQKIIGSILPFVGFALLGYWLYKSRGEYRLENDVLTVPGHPPIPINAVQAIDTSSWEKKGIAQVNYNTAAGHQGKITLDDFVYERQPIDDIYDTLVAGLKGQ